MFDFGTSDITYLALLTSASTLRLASTGTSFFGEENVPAPAPLATGKWVHVAATRRGNTVTLYVDGQPVGTNTAAEFAPFQMGETAQNWLGRAQYGGDPYLAGRLQDFRLYSGALPAAQVAALAQ